MSGVAVRRAAVGDPLSARETEVHGLICGGLRTKAIAETLQISAKTVETHRTRINQKLGTRSTREIILQQIIKIGESRESWQARVESIVQLARRALADGAQPAQA